MLGKLLDRIVSALPMPVVLAAGVVVAAAFVIRLIDESLSWRQVLSGPPFLIVALGSAVVLVGYYGVVAILRARPESRFRVDERAVLVSLFDADDESLVQALTFEQLRTAVHDIPELEDVRLAKSQHSFTEHSAAGQYCVSRRAVLCIWGTFTKPIIHARVSVANQPKSVMLTSEYPNVDNVTSTVLDYLRNAAPAEGHTSAEISRLDQQVSVLQQSNAELQETIERLSRRLRETSALIPDIQRKREAEAQRRRFAVLVGANMYVDHELPSLRGSADGAELLSATLSRLWPCSEITLLIGQDATRSAVIAAIQRCALEADAEDQIWVFFSGHSMVSQDGSILLLPYDARMQTAEFEAISGHGLRSLLSGTRAHELVLILDTSFAGSLAAEPRASFQQTAAQQTIVVLASSDSKQLALDESGFVPGLVEGLAGPADRDGDGLITAEELYHYVAGRMRETVRGHFRQTPMFFQSNLASPVVLGRTL